MTTSWRVNYLQVLNRLRMAREARGISQLDMAGRLNIGRATLQRYENGDREPSAPLLFWWADMLGVCIRADAQIGKAA